MNHIEKPDAHMELEKRWEEYETKLDKKVDALNSKISKVQLNNNFTGRR